MTISEEIFVKQLGLNQWELVSACGRLWKARGKTIYVKHRRRNSGACRYLKGLNFVKSAEEAGGNCVLQVKLK